MKDYEKAKLIFLENLKSAEMVAQRLSRSLKRVAHLFPISEETLGKLDENSQESLDAFIKRFEQLQDTVENRLFRGVAILEQENVAEMSKRDMTILMEKLGVVDSADQWSLLAILRNKLAHEYPGDHAAQAGRLNEAFDLAMCLIDSVASIRRYVESKGLIRECRSEPINSP